MRSLIISISLAATAMAQSGGTFDLSHNVFAGGGGSESTGANFKLDGSVGQSIAGTTSTGGAFSLHGGFWLPSQLAPTAAGVAIEGTIHFSGPLSYQRVRVVLTDPSRGEMRFAMPNAFGLYRFEDVQIGRLYIARAESELYTFMPDSHAFHLVDALSDVDFIAEPVQP